LALLTGPTAPGKFVPLLTVGEQDEDTAGSRKLQCALGAQAQGVFS
jgi:hypothetical protein